MIILRQSAVFRALQICAASFILLCACFTLSALEHPIGKVQDVYLANKNALVKVSAQKEISEQKILMETCTGFLTSKDGYILTSAFVTFGAKKIWVDWRGILLEAESVGYDPLTSISLIKIKGNFVEKNAPYIKLDSTKEIAEIGSPIILISRELGLAPSPNLGLVVGHDISFGGVVLPAVYLRTNLPSVNGSIGSPAFDIDGNFAGIMLASLPATNGSFFLPAKAVAKIKNELLFNFAPIYGWLGLKAEDADDGINPCVVVVLVIQNSPADKAGFMPKDIILEANSKKIENNTQLRNITFFAQPTEEISFKVKRGEKILNLDLTVDKMDPEVINTASKRFINGNLINQKNKEDKKISDTESLSK